MVSPYAAGLGGFMSGFAGGMQIGDKLKQRFDEHAAQKAREEAIAEARQQYQQQVQQQADAIEGLQQPAQPVEQNETVSVTPVQQRDVAPVELAPTDGSTAPKSVREAPAPRIPAAGGLGGAPVTQQVVATPGEDKAAAAAQRQQSTKIAQRNIGTEREAIDKAISEKMRNFYMDRGEVEKADAWEKYAESQKGRKYIKQFAGALKSLNLGDNEGFINNMVPILEDTYGEGFTIQKRSPVKDKDGNITGANFEIRNTRTGEVTTNNIPIDQLANIGMQLGSPEVVFNRFIEAQQANAKAKAEAAKEAGKAHLQTARELAVERAKQGGRVELEGIKTQNTMALKEFESQLPGALGKKVQDARAAGATEDQIKSMLQSEIEGRDTKKVTDPTERKAIIMSGLSQKFVDAMGRPTKTPEEIGAMAEQYIQQIYGTKPSAPAAQAPGSVRYARDKVTGEIVKLGPDGKPIK